MDNNKATEVLEKCVNSLHACADLVNEFGTPEQKTIYGNQLKNITKDYCKIDMKINQTKLALKLTVNEINKSNNDVKADFDSIYKKHLDEMVSTDAIASTFTQEHWILKKMSKALSDFQTIAWETPNDSVISSQSFRVPVDPIMKSQIKTPWRNKVCKHVFEYSTTLQYIQSRKKKGKVVNCPYVGCVNTDFREEDMFLDHELQSQIESMNVLEESNFQGIDLE